ncbi:MAG: cysteine desulfurase NifS [Armatimonadetes bacterium]|nr:cysteine desulfurase NifS [Armatimonadota bacterium]
MAECDCPDGCGLRIEVYQGPRIDQEIYLDHAATTPVDPAVVQAMLPFLSERFGNPSSVHGFGRATRAAVDAARDLVARCLHARPEEIYFTSGGTESNNTVLLGVTEALREHGCHVITSAIEHHAILDTCDYLQSRGVRTTVLPVDEYGLIDPEDVRRAITNETVLVSIMHANNEIGTIQPIAEIGRVCREAGVLFHTDAVQTAGSLALDVDALNVDFLSLSGHKFYGPKGVGALFARRDVPWRPLLHGGGQERHRRAGTENVPGIVGLATALGLAAEKMTGEAERLIRLRDRLIDGITARVDQCRLNGHPSQRLPNNVSLSVAGVEGESGLLILDMMGIAAAGGAACSSGSLEPSHVIQAIRVPPEAARGSIRFSLGRGTTADQIDFVVDAFAEVVAGLRSLVPNYAETLRALAS